MYNLLKNHSVFNNSVIDRCIDEPHYNLVNKLEELYDIARDNSRNHRPMFIVFYYSGHGKLIY